MFRLFYLFINGLCLKSIKHCSFNFVHVEQDLQNIFQRTYEILKVCDIEKVYSSENYTEFL